MGDWKGGGGGEESQWKGQTAEEGMLKGFLMLRTATVSVCEGMNQILTHTWKATARSSTGCVQSFIVLSSPPFFWPFPSCMPVVHNNLLSGTKRLFIPVSGRKVRPVHNAGSVCVSNLLWENTLIWITLRYYLPQNPPPPPSPLALPTGHMRQRELHCQTEGLGMSDGYL